MMGGFSLVSLCLAAVGVGGAGNFPVSKVRGVNLGGWLVSGTFHISLFETGLQSDNALPHQSRG